LRTASPGSSEGLALREQLAGADDAPAVSARSALLALDAR